MPAITAILLAGELAGLLYLGETGETVMRV
jgi:hypothetical protein